MERAYTNRTLVNDMGRIIDIFGQRSHRMPHISFDSMHKKLINTRDQFVEEIRLSFR
jgi:hypothetical protein